MIFIERMQLAEIVFENMLISVSDYLKAVALHDCVYTFDVRSRVRLRVLLIFPSP